MKDEVRGGSWAHLGTKCVTGTPKNGKCSHKAPFFGSQGSIFGNPLTSISDICSNWLWSLRSPTIDKNRIGKRWRKEKPFRRLFFDGFWCHLGVRGVSRGTKLSYRGAQRPIHGPPGAAISPHAPPSLGGFFLIKLRKEGI